MRHLKSFVTHFLIGLFVSLNCTGYGAVVNSASDIRAGVIWYDAAAYGAKGDGSTDDFVSISNAKTAAAVNGGTLYFKAGTYVIGSDLTIPANVRTYLEPGARWSVVATKTVTVLGPLLAHQTLNIGAGSVSTSGSTAIHQFRGIVKTGSGTAAQATTEGSFYVTGVGEFANAVYLTGLTANRVLYVTATGQVAVVTLDSTLNLTSGTLGVVALGGDLSGTVDNAEVNKIKNMTVPLPVSPADDGKFLQYSGGLLLWTAGNAGTVTSVGLSMPAEFSVSSSPVTTSGTLTVTRATQTANTVMAGPTSGGAATPTFRALVSGDLPSGTVSASSLTTNTLPKATAASALADSTVFQQSDGTVSIGANTDVAASIYGTGTIADMLRLNTTNSTGWITLYKNSTRECMFGFGSTGEIFTGALSDSCSFRATNALHLGGSGDSLTMTMQSGTVQVGKTSSSGAKMEVTQGTLGNEVFRAESVATNDDPNLSVFQGRAATTDASVTTLQTLTIAASTTYSIEAKVVARRTGGASGTAEDGAAYTIRAAVKNVAGTATLIGAVSQPFAAEDQAGWDATIDVTGATARIRVTGAASNNITWHVTSFVQNVGS